MDETVNPQTPLEMFFILAVIADEGIPAQTIAPKFTGRFNKGVDYVGDVAQFEKEFNDDLAVIAFAVERIRPAGKPETERPFRLRQVLDLRADRERTEAHGRRHPYQDGRNHLAGGTDRPRRRRRRRTGHRQGSLRFIRWPTSTPFARLMQPSSTSTVPGCRLPRT